MVLVYIIFQILYLNQTSFVTAVGTIISSKLHLSTSMQDATKFMAERLNWCIFVLACFCWVIASSQRLEPTFKTRLCWIFSYFYKSCLYFKFSKIRDLWQFVETDGLADQTEQNYSNFKNDWLWLKFVQVNYLVIFGILLLMSEFRVIFQIKGSTVRCERLQLSIF